MQEPDGHRALLVTEEMLGVMRQAGVLRARTDGGLEAFGIPLRWDVEQQP